ncbi:putative flavin-dependent thymidylate synthase [Serratia phage vB_SmaM-Kashira]|nr:putative thymidylate synthase [Acinetobacter phage ABPH49]URC22713.1 putative flavin-dependent thymidylate synthase [Serratia phage vB_SmaM-Kashira]
MSKVFEGRGNIFVKVIADSKVRENKEQKARVTTFELTYPRIIHAELMTHRVLTKNAMSSRAVPIATMIELVRSQPAMPVEWGSNNPGMRSMNLLGEEETAKAKELWIEASEFACQKAEELAALNAHKQIANRLLEPFQFMRTIVTGTDWNNFRWLRVDKDADPTFYELAKVMMAAMDQSHPETLKFGQWHTPYVEHCEGGAPGTFGYYVTDEEDQRVMLTKEEALAISASCCAQVSYRRLNSTKDKALDIYGRLLSGNKVHASPFEHQATPLPYHMYEKKPLNGVALPPWNWPKGVTHVSREMEYFSGNLRGFIQHRQLLENNVKAG